VKRIFTTRLVVITTIILLAIAWLLYNKYVVQAKNDFFSSSMRNRSATSVGVASVERISIPIILNALGTVSPISTVTVRPRVSGVLQQVLFQEGETVKAGQVLAKIDPRAFELTLMQQTGQRMRSEAQLENARLILKRGLLLQEQDSISQQEVETQQTLVRQLEGTLMADRAAEANARLNLSYTQVVAPMAGRIGLRNVDEGNVINANDANGIAVITQMQPIEVEFAIPQTQIEEVQTELQRYSVKTKKVDAAVKSLPLVVSAMDRSRSKVLAEGEFWALDNQVDIQTGTVKAKAHFSNERLELFPNEFVNVKFVLRTIDNALVVPVAAVRHNEGGDFVYVVNVESSTVALRKVELGQADDERIQITKGLREGEKVITEGADRLRDGSKVHLPVGMAPANAGSAASSSVSRSFSSDGKTWRRRPDGEGRVPADGEPRRKRPDEGAR